MIRVCGAEVSPKTFFFSSLAKSLDVCEGFCFLLYFLYIFFIIGLRDWFDVWYYKMEMENGFLFRTWGFSHLQQKEIILFFNFFFEGGESFYCDDYYDTAQRLY